MKFGSFQSLDLPGLKRVYMGQLLGIKGNSGLFYAMGA